MVNIVQGSKSSKYEQCIGIKLCIKNSHPNPWRLEYCCMWISVGVKNVLKVEHHLVGSGYNTSQSSLQFCVLLSCLVFIPYRVEGM